MNTRELIKKATMQLRQAGCDAPRLDAELLLMHTWHVSRTDLIVRTNETPPPAISVDFYTCVQRRIRREPLAYIIGEKEFWSRPFRISSDVLIPRPETEHLIEAVLERFPDRNGDYRFCDIGTGSGCIAVTLACEYPHACVVATDISGEALDIARHNAEYLDVKNRVVFRQGNMLAAIRQHDGSFHAVISNPPYVAAHEMKVLAAEMDREPRHALTDEQDGLQYLTTILHDGPAYLYSAGYIILETGLCGLPDTPAHLVFKQPIHDLAGLLRGGVYQLT